MISVNYSLEMEREPEYETMIQEGLYSRIWLYISYFMIKVMKADEKD